jgi:hypothetical protein
MAHLPGRGPFGELYLGDELGLDPGGDRLVLDPRFANAAQAPLQSLVCFQRAFHVTFSGVATCSPLHLPGSKLRLGDPILQRCGPRSVPRRGGKCSMPGLYLQNRRQCGSLG